MERWARPIVFAPTNQLGVSLEQTMHASAVQSTRWRRDSLAGKGSADAPGWRDGLARTGSRLSQARLE